ncbi:MAG: RNA repair domain-containing protein [Methanomicrobiales archaeon]
MRTSHTLLLKYFHDQRYSFDLVEVCYIDRGAQNDRSCVTGGQIVKLDAYYFERESPFGTTPIPYHRITRIMYDGEPVWPR